MAIPVYILIWLGANAILFGSDVMEYFSQSTVEERHPLASMVGSDEDMSDCYSWRYKTDPARRFTDPNVHELLMEW